MIITFSKLGKFGRLGNQLWQIASTIGIAMRNDANFLFPNWEYSKHFLYRLPSMDVDESLKDVKIINEYEPYYTDYKLNSKINYDLLGYFQSWKYFDHCKDMIKHYFTPNFEVNDEIFGDVAIHVRRGDYLQFNHVHPVLKMDYYNRAMDHFPNAKFAVFSDDIEWCTNNFPENKCTFILPTDPVIDMFYMATYPNQIIANSSFSWWSAWLNTNPNKTVIAPKVWVRGETKNDRIPTEWKKI